MPELQQRSKLLNQTSKLFQNGISGLPPLLSLGPHYPQLNPGQVGLPVSILRHIRKHPPKPLTNVVPTAVIVLLQNTGRFVPGLCPIWRHSGLPTRPFPYSVNLGLPEARASVCDEKPMARCGGRLVPAILPSPLTPRIRSILCEHRDVLMLFGVCVLISCGVGEETTGMMGGDFQRQGSSYLLLV